jgi:diguanylate cyclase (GGDEF)-like protein/PAS domain S-box-containing protein
MTEACPTQPQADIEARLRLLSAALEASANAIVITDLEAVIQWANSAFSTLTGYSVEEAIGKKPEDLVKSGLQSQGFYQAMWETIKSGQVWRGEMINKRKDGTLYTEALTITPVRDERGELAHFIAVKEDISARKRAEEKLRKDEANLAEAQRIGNMGSWELDLVSGALFWSEQIHRIFEIDPARFAGDYQAFLDRVNPEDRERVDRAYNESVRNGTPYDLVHRVRLPDGRIKYVHERCETIYDDDGRPLRSVGTVQDITERERLKQRLLAQSRLLEHVTGDIPLKALLEELVRFVEEQAPHLRCSILLADVALGVLRHGAAPSLPDAYNRLVDGLSIAEGSGACGTAAARRQPVVVRDVLNDPLWAPYLSLVAGHDWLRACWSTPFFDTAGRLLGTFAVYAAEVRAPSPAESDLIAYAVALASLVVERKQANEALRHGERKLATILDGVEAHIYIKDTALRYQYANRRVCELFGKTLEQVVGHGDEAFFDAATTANLRANDRRVLEHGERVETEEINVDRNSGQTRTYLSIKLPLKDERGVIHALCGISTDITERKRVEDALRASEARFRNLFEQASDGIFLISADNRYLEANTRGQEMLGYTRQELLRMGVADVLAPREWPRLRIELAWMMGGQPHLAEWLHLRKDGSTFPAEVSASRVDDSSYLAIVRDLTERKRAEARLRQAAAVFDGTREGVMVTDAELRIRMVNRAFAEITGYTEAEALGQTPSLLRSGRHDRDFYAEMWASIEACGHWQGELWNRRKNGEVYPELLSISTVLDESGRVSGYVGVFADISKLKSSEAELEFLAHHDPLTKLPNRLLLLSRLDHGIELARREDRQLALLMLDLDRFKDINDSFGHPAGDDLLRQVAARLTGRLRSVDTVSRLGGDEFTVLLEDIAYPEDAARVAEEIIAALSEPWQLGNHAEVRIGVSIGISLFPRHGASAADLLQQADAALYQVKAEGRGRFKYFSDDLTRAARERIDIEARLRRAIVRNELRVYYQPQVAIATGRVIGAEALVRWQDPEEGIVLPGRFIPVAESTGLIGAIGAWVLKQTCAQGARWLAAGLDSLKLAVNVSAHQFLAGDLVELVSRTLSETGYPADGLELELTETTLMERRQEAIVMLDRLRAIGVRLAIDDFGTGYSSLAYLKRFPLDVLKIDRSFIDDIPRSVEDNEIAATIVAMGHTLRLEVLAEGVETAEQLAFLERQGCDAYQGYLKSPPMPPEAFERLLREQAR